MPTLRMQHLRLALAVASLPLFWLLLVWFKFIAGRAGQRWVISGHRGRIKADNAGALYDYIKEHTDQPCVWIGEPGSTDSSLVRHSWRARLAIAKAPVLIYSHGEDDLDICMAACRGLTGMRVYLSHGANVVKRGSMHPELLGRVSIPRRLVTLLTAADYDLLLCQSELERTFWSANAPSKAERHVVCGGPRLDKLAYLVKGMPAPVILWFPTFRDTNEGQNALIENVEAVATHPDLLRALQESGRRLHLVLHVNNAAVFAQRTVATGVGLNEWLTVGDSAQLASQLAEAEVLVTDYSSVLADWLMFDRPAIFFPFDLLRFDTERGFHMPYENYVYGPVVTSPDELVAIIAASGWRDRTGDRARRARLRQQLLGNVAPDNSERCMTAIQDHLAVRITEQEKGR